MMSNDNASGFCPKCQNPVLKKDVICLACGTSLKNLQGGSHHIEKREDQKPVKQKIKKIFSFLFALLIFCASLIFAWVYLKDFSKFYLVTDALLMRGHWGLCENIYSGLERLALSANVEEVKFYRQQLQKETALHSKNKTLEMHIVDYYVDPLGLHLKLSVTNKTSFSILIHNRCFYLKIQKSIFPAYFATDTENIGHFKLRPQKTITGGLLFNKAAGTSFNGKIVFNDGKKYAIIPISLDVR